MLENKERIGNFTSSEIYKLIKKGRGKNDLFSAAGMTYIKEKKIEKRMGRSIQVESYSRSMAWGIFMEMIVFSKIGLEYKIESKDTDLHPTINGWSGSKDLIVPNKKIADIKCYELKKFALYTGAILKGDLNEIKQDFPKEYWQLVSNAIINDVPNAEIITYIPYESELEEIRQMAENYDRADKWKYRFIYESDKISLPYLPDGGYYKNLNYFEFEVPKEEKELLTERVLEAINYEI